MKLHKNYAIWLSEEIIHNSWFKSENFSDSVHKQWQSRASEIICVSGKKFWLSTLYPTEHVRCTPGKFLVLWVWCDSPNFNGLQLWKKLFAASSSYSHGHTKVLLRLLWYFIQKAGSPDLLRSCLTHLEEFNSDIFLPSAKGSCRCEEQTGMLKVRGMRELVPHLLIMCWHIHL